MLVRTARQSGKTLRRLDAVISMTALEANGILPLLSPARSSRFFVVLSLFFLAQSHIKQHFVLSTVRPHVWIGIFRSGSTKDLLVKETKDGGGKSISIKTSSK